MTTRSDDPDRMPLAGPPSFGLEGRVAWVTGASRGLGRTIACALVAAGAEVVVSARDAAALDALATTLVAAGGRAHAVPMSIDSTEAVDAAAAAIAERVGRLDVLVANAGISPGFNRSERVSDREWNDVVGVNLSGTFATCRAAVRLMGETGSIVCVSSVHSVSGHQRLAAYSASKGGVEALVRTLAVEWAPKGIRVNAVAPGYVATDMSRGLLQHEHWSARLLERIPLGRFADTREIAPAVLFLAGDAASYVTGTTLFVDGGWTAA